MKRVAFVVSHPIQYYAPLHRRLAARAELQVKVFFTWHSGTEAVLDRGFGAEVAWDVPLTDGYEFERVPNAALNPGTHSFWGLENPTLVERLLEWKPDLVHVTGWAWRSHLIALRALHLRGVETMFRGDSHLLDGVPRGPRWWAKRLVLGRIYSWPSTFLYVGSANRTYFEALGVPAEKLFYCPHSIDVGRFAENAEEREGEAAIWRREIGFSDRDRVLLFAGKFERKKRPVEMLRAVLEHGDPRIKVLLVGGGELAGEVASLAASNAERVRVLPFQNQSRMPLVYRLGDLFILPSAWGETWGLAVNEALACGRPVLVSDRVGCGADVIDPESGRVFPWQDWLAMTRSAQALLFDSRAGSGPLAPAARQAWKFDLRRTESTLLSVIDRKCAER